MKDILGELNAAQREAVTAPPGPILVVAGAGSGKTRVLTTRIAYLLRDGTLSPADICAFTFTNKAAREMRERVEVLVGDGRSPRWISTFHAAGARILRRDGLHEGIDPSFAILDTDDTQRLLKQVMLEAGVDPKQITPPTARHVISRWKNEDVSPDAARLAARGLVEERCALVYAAYEKALRAGNALDFDDLILRTVHLLENVEPVLHKYARRFCHVLVDEFQDTNALQLVLVKALCSHHGNVFVVGDDDQSIYSWRGACIENMLRFDEYFPGTRVLRLEQNYRSTGRILAAANAVIEHNRRRKGKRLWTEAPLGERLRVELLADAEEEAAQVAGIVQRELGRGSARRDLTILYRTNAQSRLLESALQRAALPYQIVGSTQFYERREVRDMLAYLKLVANPRDEVSALRVLNVPKRKIGAATTERFLAAAHDEGLTLGETAARAGLLEASLAPAACQRLRSFFERVGRWRRIAASLTVPDLLQTIMTDIDYAGYLAADDPGSAKERQENLGELVNAAHDFHEASDGAGLTAFLEQVALVSDVDGLSDEQGAVRLMTIHTAKGLEFPVVILVGCEEDLLPHASSLGDGAGEEEERRLFYVALTRARRRVYLLHALRRRRYGAYENASPSRFLAEIPEEHAERRREGLATAAGGARLWSGPATGRPALGGPPSRPSRDPQARDADKVASIWGHDLSQDEIRFHVGQTVLHASFGRGVVARVEGGGLDLTVSVDFPGSERKHFLARLAHLRPVD